MTYYLRNFLYNLSAGYPVAFLRLDFPLICCYIVENSPLPPSCFNFSLPDTVTRDSVDFILPGVCRHYV